MTVKELIASLSAENPDMLVMLYDPYGRSDMRTDEVRLDDGVNVIMLFPVDADSTKAVP